jgi:hypothetical protein
VTNSLTVKQHSTLNKTANTAVNVYTWLEERSLCCSEWYLVDSPVFTTLSIRWDTVDVRLSDIDVLSAKVLVATSANLQVNSEVSLLQGLQVGLNLMLVVHSETEGSRKHCE